MEYVYFFRETGRPYVKIGMSKNDFETRFNQFKIYAPLGAYVIGYIKTNDALKLEKDLHKKYKDKRLSGEFFTLTDDEVYREINNYNASFGEIISFLNELIENYDYSLTQLKYDLIEKLKKASYQKDKYAPNEILLSYLQEKKGCFLTNNKMIEELNEKGCIIGQYQLGLTLKNLGYHKKRKKINGTSSIVYII
jgi:hypothetical protein